MSFNQVRWEEEFRLHSASCDSFVCLFVNQWNRNQPHWLRNVCLFFTSWWNILSQVQLVILKLSCFLLLSQLYQWKICAASLDVFVAIVSDVCVCVCVCVPEWSDHVTETHPDGIMFQVYVSSCVHLHLFPIFIFTLFNKHYF